MNTEPVVSARRSEIIDAAARLFEERGYHHVSMDDIAAAVGIKKPTLYHHVRSKSQIVLWIHDELADELSSRLTSRIDGGAAPAESLLGALDDILELLHDRPGRLRVYFEHHRELPAEEGRASLRRRDAYFATVRGVIEDGMARGDFRAVDPVLTTFAFFGMSNWTYQWYRTGGAVSAHGVAQQFWRIFLSGIGGPREAS